jgi:hypothetical protein
MEKRTVSLPTRIWNWIDKLDIDPVRKKPRYGAQTRFFERICNQEIRRVDGVKALADEEGKGV